MKFSELMKAPLANLWEMREFRLVLNHLGVTRADKVLEIGCGGGFGSFILSRRAREVVSIDISEELIR